MRFQAYRIHKKDKKVFGKLETLHETDLGDADTLIRVQYSSVNYKDALGATGAGKIFKQFPLIGGIDAVGTVQSSPQFPQGQAVLATGCGLGESQNGGYTEYLRLPAQALVPLPVALSLKEAMVLGTAGFTAALCLYQMEQNGQKPPGPIVVTGASGGVGMIAVNLLANQGYKVIAVSGKEALQKKLLDLGAAEVCSLKDLALGERPLEKARWAGAIDNLGGNVLAGLTRHINLWGNVASVGMAAGVAFQSTVMPHILRGVNLLGISSNNCPSPLRLELWQRLASQWKPPNLAQILEKTITLSGLEDVFQQMLQRKTHGRTLVKVVKGP